MVRRPICESDFNMTKICRALVQWTNTVFFKKTHILQHIYGMHLFFLTLVLFMKPHFVRIGGPFTMAHICINGLIAL